MAKNDFLTESASNYEQKCLCVLVLDTSGSMMEVISGDVKQTGRTETIDGKLYNIVEGGVTKLDELNSGLQEFYLEIENDESTSQKLEVSLIAFNDYVKTIQEPALVENFVMPTLQAEGETAMVDAVNEAISKVQARKEWYKSTGQNYYRPWIILITDGEPNSNQDIDTLSSRIKADTEAKRYAFLPIGVEGADMSVLNKIAGDIPAMPLNGAKFSQFFKWLSASMGIIVNETESDKVTLANPDDWWENIFEI